MHVLITSFYGNPNVGLYGYCTEEYCLLGTEVPEEKVQQIAKTLNVPTYQLTIAGTSLLGVFLAGNSNTLLVPDIAFDHEIHKIKELHIPFTIIKTRHTCLGNNIIANDKCAFLHPDYKERERQQIAEALQVPIMTFEAKQFRTPGSLIVTNPKGMLISDALDDETIDVVTQGLAVPAMLGTVNLGSSYVKSGILTNGNGFIMGDTSGGPEVVDAEKALGFAKYQ
jgi:translation initiation factor 6